MGGENGEIASLACPSTMAKLWTEHLASWQPSGWLHVAAGGGQGSLPHTCGPVPSLGGCQVTVR